MLLVRVVEIVVLFAAIVVVPLGLLAIARKDRHGADDRVERRVRRSFALAGVLLAIAFRFPATPWAKACSTIYVLACAAVAWLAVRRAMRRSRFRLEEAAIDLGLLYLVVGGAWAFAYANEMEVMGFAGLQCLLTSAHFHYAGFGACVVAGLLGRALPDRGVLRAAVRPVTIGIMSGVALLAAGIAAFRPLERVAAWVVAASLVGVGLLLVARSLRAGPAFARVALALAGVSTFSSGALAVWFSATGFEQLGLDALRTMIELHGLVNAIGFVTFGLVGLLVLRPASRAAPAGLPFSRLSGRGRAIGPGFFARQGVEDPSRTVTGLIDDFSEYARDDFDPSTLHAGVREFYERTNAFTLWVTPTWQPGWSLAARIWKAFARRMNQLNLPHDRAAVVHAVTSRMTALREDRDGRTSPRGWVRTYRRDDGSEGPAVYVAAYSSNARDGGRTMNIAFPLPVGNMTSVLRLDVLDVGGGVSLSTLAHPGESTDGDQGVYWVTPLGPVRLPLDETIRVWSARADEGWAARHPPPDGVPAETIELLATHDMWLLGMRYVRLVYHIARVARG